MNREKKTGIMMMSAAALLWSMAGVLIKFMTWSGPEIAGIRSLIAALTILAYIKNPKIRLTRAKTAAIISYALTVSLFSVANKYTAASNAILLQYTAPAYAAILGAWVLKERIGRWDIISIFVIFGGMVLFLFDNLGGGGLFGNALALLSGVMFGAMNVFIRLEKGNETYQCVFWGNICAFVIMLPFMDGMRADVPNILAIIALGVFQLGVSYIFYTKAIKSLTAFEATVVPAIEPVLNTLWVLIFMGEAPSVLAVIGGAVVLFGVVGREFFTFRQKDATATSPSEAKDKEPGAV